MRSKVFFVCTSCGFRANADHNSAINILNRGNTPGVESGVNRSLKRELSEKSEIFVL